MHFGPLLAPGEPCAEWRRCSLTPMDAIRRIRLTYREALASAEERGVQRMKPLYRKSEGVPQISYYSPFLAGKGDSGMVVTLFQQLARGPTRTPLAKELKVQDTR